MEIRLKESELDEAVELWIESQGFNLDDKRVEINYTAGRAPNGFSAEVETFNAPQVTKEVTNPVPVTANTDERAEVPEPEPENDSPFIDDEKTDPSVDENQQALDLDLDL